MTRRIAMWSGPRNISTAMMRAWENRPDCFVWDEPLYAAYLRNTGIEHPMREQIIANDEDDWQAVVRRCCAAPPDNSAVFYQKHMTHHMLADYSRDWLGELTNCFLIRDPREVIVSYTKLRKQVSMDDIGLPQQCALFDYVRERQKSVPLVIDSQAFLRNPRAYLRAICDRLGIQFTETMLFWPAGPRATDGIWAAHWYANVWRTTGFKPAPADSEKTGGLLRDEELADAASDLLKVAIPVYEQLREHALVIR